MTPPQNENADQGVGSAQDHNEHNPVIRAVEKAVTELQTARIYIERDLKEGRDDMKGVLQRLAQVETKVSDLPSKVWIGGVVAAGAGVLFGLLTLVFKLTGH